MQFENIKIKYYKALANVQIEYFQTRKPSLLEFLLIQIIISHPEKEKSFLEILKDDFDISEPDLFEKSFKELRRVRIIEENNLVSIVSQKKGFTAPIRNYLINKKILDNFQNGKYLISQEIKVKKFYLIYDYIANNWEIQKSKTNLSSTGSYQFEIQSKKEISVSKEKVIDIAKDFFSKNDDIFSKEDNIKSIFIDGIDIEKLDQIFLNSPENYLLADKNINMNIDENQNIFIESDDLFVASFFNENEKLKSEIASFIIEQYSKKIAEIFAAKRGKILQDLYLNKSYTFENLPTPVDAEILFINNDDFFAEERVFKIKKIVQGIPYIFVYNSKGNSRFQEEFNGKTVFYLNQIENIFFDSSTLVYYSKTYGFLGLGLLNSSLSANGLEVPLFKMLKKDSENQKNIQNSFLNNLALILKQCLEIKEFQKALAIIKFFDQFGFLKNALEVIENQLVIDLKKGRFFEEISLLLNENSEGELLKIVELTLMQIIVKFSQKATGMDFINVIRLYSFKNNKDYEKYLKKISITFSLEEIYLLNEVLQNNNIEIWKNNYFNCLKILVENFYQNPKVGFGVNLEVESEIYQQHIDFFTNFSILNTYFHKKQFFEIKDQFLKVFNCLNKILENIENIENDRAVYLLLLANIMIMYYQDYHRYLSQKLSLGDLDAILEKKQEMLKNYYELDEKMNSELKEELKKLPLEFKVIYLSYVDNKKEIVDKIITTSAVKINQLVIDIFS
ncbi:hypothetical protein SSABA_v1c07210 [Spiroplasma sabaudiense Ar-1343]|uniref:Uncharacterized protein n=1 Tax=Spiroplasma sabaudiense Ar-1343 TaxID=1276257 RepID=W6AAA7_9MOLU|nr:hypothetical protein [Spiroplasma sabaudiense]AHI54123.1 hypothetical protein SSABA_v1c07210 [Spiroplasma sabaudiense Ar-1343]